MTDKSLEKPCPIKPIPPFLFSGHLTGSILYNKTDIFTQDERDDGEDLLHFNSLRVVDLKNDQFEYN